MGLQASIKRKGSSIKGRAPDVPLKPSHIGMPDSSTTFERTVLNLPTALSLYDLKESELFWELQLDTRCLMGWSNSKIVVSFRGTASMKNAVADMQVCISTLQTHLLPQRLKSQGFKQNADKPCKHLVGRQQYK